MAEIVAHAAEDHPIDPDRLFLFGHSAGAQHAMKLANDPEAPWRAVGMHGGYQPMAELRSSATLPPVRVYLRNRDHLFPLHGAVMVGRALAAAGHRIDLVEIDQHTHWYYVIGPFTSRSAWAFFKAQR